MRFLLDESADFRLGQHLSANGHDVTSISREYPQALKDEEVLSIALDEKRVLITRDRDFGELIFRHRLRHSGVILVRFNPLQIELAKRAVDRLVAEHAHEIDQFLVVSERGVRVRRQPAE